MQFLKNKHLILAMFIAPLLAVIAYFTVDKVVSEKPHVAVQGGKYKLLARSNCRYKSGVCTLENGDIKIKLHLEAFDDKSNKLFLRSNIPVQNVLVSFVGKTLVDQASVGQTSVSPNEESNGGGFENTEPLQMQASTERLDVWWISINQSLAKRGFLRLVVSISNTFYYAETSSVFIDYETSFSRDNFSN